MMTTDTTTGQETRPSLAAPSRAGQRTRSCACGQQMDLCASDHCTRCGRTVARP